MTNKEKTLRKLEKLWKDECNWNPPHLQWLADKIGVSKSLVFKYLKELKNKGII